MLSLCGAHDRCSTGKYKDPKMKKARIISGPSLVVGFFYSGQYVNIDSVY